MCLALCTAECFSREARRRSKREGEDDGLNTLRGWQDRQQSGQQLEMWPWRSENRSGPEDTNLGVSHIAVTMETPGYLTSPTQKIEISEESSGYNHEPYPWIRD